MNRLKRLLRSLKPRDETPEELAEHAESQRIRDDMQTARLSQRSTAGQNYQSGRGSHQ